MNPIFNKILMGIFVVAAGIFLIALAVALVHVYNQK